MGKKNKALATIEEIHFTDIQKPMPKKQVSSAGIKYYEYMSYEEEAEFEEKKESALAAMHSQLTQEFTCKNPSEKILVKLLEDDYTLRATYREKLLLALDENLAMKNNHTLKIIHTLERALDHCERRITRNMQILKAMKQPPMKVKVMGNAIIGQNQQLNNIHGKIPE